MTNNDVRTVLVATRDDIEAITGRIAALQANLADQTTFRLEALSRLPGEDDVERNAMEADPQVAQDAESVRAKTELLGTFIQSV